MKELDFEESMEKLEKIASELEERKIKFRRVYEEIWRRNGTIKKM